LKSTLVHWIPVERGEALADLRLGVTDTDRQTFATDVRPERHRTDGECGLAFKWVELGGRHCLATRCATIDVLS